MESAGTAGLPAFFLPRRAPISAVERMDGDEDAMAKCDAKNWIGDQPLLVVAFMVAPLLLWLIAYRLIAADAGDGLEGLAGLFLIAATASMAGSADLSRRWHASRHCGVGAATGASPVPRFVHRLVPLLPSLIMAVGIAAAAWHADDHRLWPMLLAPLLAGMLAAMAGPPGGRRSGRAATAVPPIATAPRAEDPRETATWLVRVAAVASAIVLLVLVFDPVMVLHTLALTLALIAFVVMILTLPKGL